MNELPCGHLDGAEIFSAAARLKLSFPGAHKDGASMARISFGLKKDRAAALCSLPFCCTVEAEALGASVTLGDAVSGPRAKEYVCSSLRDVLGLKTMDLAAGRISQVLSACSLLSEGGEPVALEISGPMTILNWLMDLSVVFKEWRKDETLMREVLARLGDDLRQYAQAVARRNAALLCYADPTGSLAVLGPKRFAFLADVFLIPFLRSLENDPNFQTAVQICPKVSHTLVLQDRAAWLDLPVKRPMPYDEACLATARAGYFFGEACVKNTHYYLKDSKIRRLILV